MEKSGIPGVCRVPDFLINVFVIRVSGSKPRGFAGFLLCSKPVCQLAKSAEFFYQHGENFEN